jgi:voltage-gated potassium channel
VSNIRGQPKSRHPILDFLGERLVKAFGIFIATWLVGGACLYAIGFAYGANREPVMPDGSLDTANFGFLNCLYLASMVVSTLGLADMTMLSRLPGSGRDVIYIFMIAYALISYLLVVYASAQMISYVVEGALSRYLEKRRMIRDLNNTKDHYVVCGLGATGFHIVAELVKVEVPVVGLDTSPENVAACKNAYPGEIFLEGDATQDDVLEKAGIKRATGLFASLAEDRDNIITVLSARAHSPNLRVVARAQDVKNTEKLKRVGANVTISPNHIGGMRMASEMVRPAVTTFLDTMLRSQAATTRFENVILRPEGPAVGKSLRTLDVQAKTGLVVVATVKVGGGIDYNPHPDTIMGGGDALVVIASPDQKRSLESMLNG